MSDIEQDVRSAIHIIHTQLSELQGRWLVGGSCGLMWQDVALERPPRDLDIYADLQTAEQMARLLRPYATDEPQWDETPIYRSYLSHYEVANVSVEVVGAFEVRAKESVYRVQVEPFLADYAVVFREEHTPQPLLLMPLAHELVFNVLRDRQDRYVAIADTMRDHPQQLAVLREWVHLQRLSEEHRRIIEDLIGDSLES